MVPEHPASEAVLEIGKRIFFCHRAYCKEKEKKKEQKNCNSCFIRFGCFVGVLLIFSPTKEELKIKKKTKTPQSFECSDIYYVNI